MRPIPRSLFGRLLGIAALTTLAALAFAAVAIGHVLERFVIRGLDQQLDAQVAILARAVRPDGTLDDARVIELPVFDAPGAGWSWRVDGADGRRWMHGLAFDVASMPPPRERRWAHDDGLLAGEGRTRSGEPIHFRRLAIATARGPVTITASGPRRLALAPLHDAVAPLLASLALLGAALALATLLQVRFGLRPLRTLRADLAAVRAGRAAHIPFDQPDELISLAAELNALIDQNAAGLAHARRHVANLAHGLKTPLAALSVTLAEGDRDADGRLGELVAQIDRRIRHHLGRARAASPGGATRVRTPLAPAIADLVHALDRIHAERALIVTTAVAPDLAVAVDLHDLNDMAGNLLDNAWRHARATVRITASRVDAAVVLSVEDDGPGLADAAIVAALIPGRRLDERGDGHGFGLPITQELAELNGGSLALGRSTELGGLRATLRLPRAGD